MLTFYFLIAKIHVIDIHKKLKLRFYLKIEMATEISITLIKNPKQCLVSLSVSNMKSKSYGGSKLVLLFTN